MKPSYTIDRVTLATPHLFVDVGVYIYQVAPEIAKMYGDKFDWRNADLLTLIRDYIFLVCKRDGEIRGHMICFLTTNALDPKVKILRQLMFYVKPDSGRTAYYLFHKFIDIGKNQADHIITMLTSHTNIKPNTLKNLGFEELETLYRLEIK